MTITLKLLDSISEIEKKINFSLSEKINDILNKNQNKIVNSIIALIPGWIKKQPEIQALLSRSLIGEIGTTISSVTIVDSIIRTVCNSTSIKFVKYNKNLTGGGFEINIQPLDFSNLLSLPEGHTIYKDGDLHWLQWLLLRGDEIIVIGYEYNPKTGIGRTKLGNMIKGKGFRIPPQYSGTSNNNFITRSLIGPDQEKDITKIFESILGA